MVLLGIPSGELKVYFARDLAERYADRNPIRGIERKVIGIGGQNVEARESHQGN